MAAGRKIEAEGTHALTLRSLAADVGVSHPATYRHFADKRAVLAEVALEGFMKLRQALEEAANQSAPALVEMQKAGAAYVEFAADNPGVFRLMFGETLGDRRDHPQLRDAADSCFQVLLGALGRCQEQGLVRSGELRGLATVAWGLVHGLATLGVDGQLAQYDADRGAVADLAYDVLYRGLQPDKGSSR